MLEAMPALGVTNTPGHANPEETQRPSATGPSLAYALSFFNLGLAVAILGPTLPDLALQTQVGLQRISFFFVAVSLGYLVGSLCGGGWYDRLPGHRIMVIALLPMATSLFAVPFLTSYWLLAVALGGLGFAEGMIDVGGNTLIGWVQRDRVGPWLNFLHFSFGAGAASVPLLVALGMLLGSGITLPYCAVGLLILPAAIWLAKLESPIHRSVENRTSSAPIHGLLVLLFSVFIGFYVGAEVGFSGWIFTYATTMGLHTEMTAAYLSSLFWAALTIGRLFGIPLASRFRPQSILVVDLVGCLASVSAVLLWPGSSIMLWFGTAALGLAMASIFPAAISFAGRLMPVTGRVTAWFIVGSSGGSMLLPWLMGQFFEFSGARATLWILWLDLAATSLLLGVIVRRHLKKLQSYSVRRSAW